LASGNDFQKDIAKSKAEIAEADTKGKRGRKPLPRDGQGNIIRSDSPNSAPGGVIAVNPQAIEENKQILRVAAPALNSLVTKRALAKENFISEEEITILVDSGAVILEKYMPSVMNKYGMEFVFIGTLAQIAVRMEGHRREVIAASKVNPAAPKDGKLPVDNASKAKTE
jgi:hypothetical protein